jgi:hypothetical protein
MVHSIVIFRFGIPSLPDCRKKFFRQDVPITLEYRAYVCSYVPLDMLLRCLNLFKQLNGSQSSDDELEPRLSIMVAVEQPRQLFGVYFQFKSHDHTTPSAL